jgi:hypothetical protein
MERRPIAPAPRDSTNWTASQPIAPPPPRGGDDDWVVTNVSAAVRALEAESAADQHGDDGTPIEGVPAAPALGGGSFVAGEIDVPTPPPLRRAPVERDNDTPAVEFTAASAFLGQPEPADRPDPDTGSRTPPLERR